MQEWRLVDKAACAGHSDQYAIILIAHHISVLRAARYPIACMSSGTNEGHRIPNPLIDKAVWRLCMRALGGRPESGP